MKRKLSIILSIFLIFAMLCTACKPSGTKNSSSKTSSYSSTKKSADNTSDPEEEETDDGNESTTEDEDDWDDDWEDEWEDDWDDDFDEEDDDEDWEEEVEMLAFDSHVVVYGASTSERQQVIVGKLSAVLDEKYQMSDLLSDEKTNDTTPEILVGNTNRAESKKAMEALNKNRKNNAADYIIMVENENIVIAATSDYALQEAVDYFKKTYCRADFPEIPADLHKIYRPEIKSGKHQIAGVDISEYVIVTPWDKAFIYSREIESFVDTIRKLSGYEIPVTDDRSAEKIYEILVGDTNRSQSKVTLAENKYVLEQNGKKIVAKGGHSYSTATAVLKLTEMANSSIKSAGVLKLASGIKTSGTYTPAANDYKLVWYDEFNGTELDLNKWERLVESQAAWNGGLCYRTDKEQNSRVENGNLIIQGNKLGENSYESAKVLSHKSMHYQYGYIEIRAKLPAGRGIWPGFWFTSKMANPAGGPEIDMFEMFGTSHTIASHIHKWWNEDGVSQHVAVNNFEPHKRSYKLPEDKIFHDDYHTLGFEWTEEYMHFFIDGHNFTSMDIRKEDMEPFHQPIAIILSMAVGLLDVMSPDETTPWDKVKYIIDYIHLFQKPGVGQLITK